MIINFKFTSQDGREIEGMRTELDRNYADEETALVFIPNMKSDTGGYFELNLRKDEQGHFTGGGYVCEYDSEDDSQESYINTDIELEVIEHDFDETLAKANEKLRPFGKKIVVDYDGEGYFAIGSTDMDGSNADYYAEGEFEHEVQADIWECLAHVLARVQNPEQWQQGQDTMAQIRKLWENLAGMEQVDMMVEFYSGLMDGEKDRFLRETDNP